MDEVRWSMTDHVLSEGNITDGHMLRYLDLGKGKPSCRGQSLDEQMNY